MWIVDENKKSLVGNQNDLFMHFLVMNCNGWGGMEKFSPSATYITTSYDHGQISWVIKNLSCITVKYVRLP